jgi:hypothetical protein
MNSDQASQFTGFEWINALSEQGRGSLYTPEAGDRFVRPKDLKSLGSSMIDFGERPIFFYGPNVDPDQ